MNGSAPMTFTIRSYQQRAIDRLYDWWTRHGAAEVPLLVLPTGSGKSIVIAELVRLLWDTWPEDHPRTIVLVPSKELAEQNADKLLRVLPAGRSVGYYSASLGQKRQDCDVIVATIGSVYRDAHLLGAIRCVIVDEAHLVNPDGAGRYRQFIDDISALCPLVAVGLTATPFRGDGVWLTDGKDPLFSGIACEVPMVELLDAGHLAPLVRPMDALATRIDTDDLAIVNGDYRLDDLAERVDRYLPGVVRETVAIAADRKKWIAFTPNVLTAQHLVAEFRGAGVSCALVCGETPKREREDLIADFRAGRLRCLVTVLALATGFDVPDVDCIVWCRPTRSPVLYVQGAGRGTRPADGKTDCLWLDFSDTTERMGPIDKIRGRKRPKPVDQAAPYAVCPDCGAHVRPANLLFCPECGARMRELEEKRAQGPSNAAILSRQLMQKVLTYPVTDVQYSVHRKPGSPDSMRVDYYSGIKRVASEWVCFEHQGFARAKAEIWWSKRSMGGFGDYCHMYAHGSEYPGSSAEAVETATAYSSHAIYPFAVPSVITVDETGRWPEIVGFTWSTDEPNRTDRDPSSVAEAT